MKKKIAKIRARIQTLPARYKAAIVAAYIVAMFLPFPGPTPALTAFLSRYLGGSNSDTQN